MTSTWVVTIEYAGRRSPAEVDELDDLLDRREATVMPAVGGGIRVSVWIAGTDPLDAAQAARTLVATVIDEAPRRVAVTREDDYVREAQAPTLPELVSAPVIAELLGISRQRVHQLQSTPGFPAPLVVLRTGPVWDRRAVEAYSRASRRRTAAV